MDDVEYYLDTENEENPAIVFEVTLFAEEFENFLEEADGKSEKYR